MVEINGYSREKDGGRLLSTHFKVREFACRDGSDVVLAAPRLVMVLESIRTHFNAAVRINSGYRTPQYNAQVGGSAHSQHCYGTAADITVAGQTPEAVAAYQYLSDADKRNVFDVERYMKRRPAIVKPDEPFDMYELNASDLEPDNNNSTKRKEK